MKFILVENKIVTHNASSHVTIYMAITYLSVIVPGDNGVHQGSVPHVLRDFLFPWQITEARRLIPFELDDSSRLPCLWGVGLVAGLNFKLWSNKDIFLLLFCLLSIHIIDLHRDITSINDPLGQWYKCSFSRYNNRSVIFAIPQPTGWFSSMTSDPISNWDNIWLNVAGGYFSSRTFQQILIL